MCANRITKLMGESFKLHSQSLIGYEDSLQAGQQMEEKNVKYRPAIDKLLKASGMDGVDDVINKAASLIAPQERGEFEAVSSHSFQPEIWDADTLSSIIAH